jgi:hypothetical protein
MMRAAPQPTLGIGRLALALALAATGAAAYVVTQVRAEIELAQVDIIVRNIRTGLQIAVGERIMRGQDDRLAALLQANPLDFLGAPPVGYVGETSVPGSPGSWRFDPVGRLLEYRPQYPAAFGGREELRWRLAAAGTVAGRPVGLRLVRG